MTVREDKLRSEVTGFSRAVAFIVMAFAAIALVGWTLDIQSLRSVIPGLTPMNPATAIAFLLCGIALSTVGHKTLSGWRGERWLAVAILCIGAARLVANVAHISIPVDTTLFHAKLGANTMAANTAIC